MKQQKEGKKSWLIGFSLEINLDTLSLSLHSCPLFKIDTIFYLGSTERVSDCVYEYVKKVLYPVQRVN